MSNNYIHEKQIEKLFQKGHTNFINQEEFLNIKNKISKKEYQIFSPYHNSEKIILYRNNIPHIVVYKINCKIAITHSQILGTLFSLNIKPDMYGDIINYNNSYYLYCLPEISKYLLDNLTEIGNNKITLSLIEDYSIINYEPKREYNEVIISSLRIDNIVAAITNLSKKEVLNKINNKEVIINYKTVTNNSKELKENDIFSVRRYGKYQYLKIVKVTKKNKLVISYLKYI